MRVQEVKDRIELGNKSLQLVSVKTFYEGDKVYEVTRKQVIAEGTGVEHLRHFALRNIDDDSVIEVTVMESTYIYATPEGYMDDIVLKDTYQFRVPATEYFGIVKRSWAGDITTKELMHYTPLAKRKRVYKREPRWNVDDRVMDRLRPFGFADKFDVSDFIDETGLGDTIIAKVLETAANRGYIVPKGEKNS